MILEKLYIFINNSAYKVTKHINNKIKNVGTFSCCLLLALHYLVQFTGEVEFFNFLYIENQNIFLLILLVLLVFFGIRKEIKQIEWNILLTIPYQIIAVAIFIYGVIHSIEIEYVFGIILLFVFPCFYIAWFNSNNYSILFNCLAISFTLVGTYYCAVCVHLAYNKALLFENDRLRASMGSPNVLGFVEMCSVLSCLYLINKYINKFYVVVPCILSFAMSCVIIYMTGSRSNLLCILSSIICYLIFRIKQYKKEKIVVNIIKICVFIAVCITVIINIKPASNWLIKIYEDSKNGVYDKKTEVIEENTSNDIAIIDEQNSDDEQVLIEEIPEEYVTVTIGIGDGVDIKVNRIYSKYNVELKEVLGMRTPLYEGDVISIDIKTILNEHVYFPVYAVQGATKKEENTYIVGTEEVIITTGCKTYEEYEMELKAQEQEAFKQNLVSANDRFLDLKNSLKSLSSERIRVYKLYASKCGFFGNSINDIPDEAFYECGIWQRLKPHNNYLEMAFRFGIPIGTTYLLFIAACCVLNVILLFGRKYIKPEYLFMIVFTAAFFIQSLVEIATFYENQATTIVFYMSLAPLFVREKRKNI